MNDLRGDTHKHAPKLRSYGRAPLKPPAWLDKLAKEYWRRIAPSLVQEGILNPVTYDLLATGAQAYSNYRHALQKLEEQGRVITSGTGAVKPNPWTTIEKQSFEQLARVYKDLQINGPVAPVDDELDKFLINE